MTFINEKEEFKKSIPEIEAKYKMKILLAYVRGSHMYGTSTEASDVDITFIYIQPTDEILKKNHVKYIDVTGTGDIVGHEIETYIELLSVNNPTMLETLDIPEDCLIYKHESMKVFEHQGNWITKLTENTILGYGKSQIRKATGLNKKMNNPQPKDRKSILEFCYVVAGHETVSLLKWANNHSVNIETCGLVDLPVGKGLHAMYVDEGNKYGLRGLVKDNDSVNLRLSSIPKELAEYADPVTIYYNLDGFQTHCKDWVEYWKWEKERNDERYKLNQKAGQGVDLKNMSHLFRLLEMALNISLGKGIIVRSETVEFLREIKEGKHDYKELMIESERLTTEIKNNFETIDLPKSVPIAETKNLLLKFRKEQGNFVL